MNKFLFHGTKTSGKRYKLTCSFLGELSLMSSLMWYFVGLDII